MIRHLFFTLLLVGISESSGMWWNSRDDIDLDPLDRIEESLDSDLSQNNTHDDNETINTTDREKNDLSSNSIILDSSTK